MLTFARSMLTVQTAFVKEENKERIKSPDTNCISSDIKIKV